MKNSKTCPKCNSKEIYTDSGVAPHKRSERGHLRISSSNWTVMFVDIYACYKCGYIEEYITNEDLNDPKKFEKLQKNWKKA